MLTRKKKQQATIRLNKYMAEELNNLGMVDTNKDIHNKIDSIIRKEKQFYSTCSKTRKE